MAFGLAACGGSHHSSSAAKASGAAAVTASSSAASGSGGGAASHTSSSAVGSRTSATGATGATGATHSATALPGSVAATVAGRPITVGEYQASYSRELRAATSTGIPLDPPGFGRCAAGFARQYRLFDKRLVHVPHRPIPARQTLVKQCRARLATLKQGAIGQLIEQRWTELQAQADHIAVSAATVNAAVASQRRALGGARAFARYLARTGQSEQQVASQLRLSLIDQRLQQLRLGPQVAVSESQIRAYFTAHHAEFVLPRAKAPKLSTYQTRIRLLLSEQVRAQRAAAATSAFERRWRARTICRPGYVVSSLCANAP